MLLARRERRNENVQKLQCRASNFTAQALREPLRAAGSVAAQRERPTGKSSENTTIANRVTAQLRGGVGFRPVVRAVSGLVRSSRRFFFFQNSALPAARLTFHRK